ncbi:MAG: hypothetical protein U5K77_01360 [Candidatus Saccharibacteria bacterium]|nr:hypothetical protein [Candidatus Saccharibacteria bacterium]
MSEQVPYNPEESETNWLLDREAGSWRFEGINQELREKIARREELVDRMLHDKYLYGVPSDELLSDYQAAVTDVLDLKKELGIDDPPPLSTKDD